MDVILLAQNGIDNVVATLGTATTINHIHLLLRLCPEVTFCFDGDRAGRDAAMKALKTALPIINKGPQIGFSFLPDGEDPDSLVRKKGRDGFLEQVAHPTPLSTLLISHLETKHPDQSIDGKARLIAAARPLIREIPHGLYRDMVVEELSSRSGIPLDKLERSLSAADTERIQPESPGKPRGSVRSSLPRQAITLLLQCPELVSELEEEAPFTGLNLPGVTFLEELIQLLKANPDMATAAIIEHWRDTKYGKHLSELVTHGSLQDPEEMRNEFRGAIDALARSYTDQEIQKLTAKPHEQWTEDDRKRMKQLLEKKRQRTHS